MIRKSHNHTLQTNPQHREEEPQNTKSHKMSMERYVRYTDLTRSGEHDITAAILIMYMENVEIYLVFNRFCTINGLKTPWGPLFSAPRYMINLLFIKRKYMNALIFQIGMAKMSNVHVYAHIFRSNTRQAFVFTFT